MRARIHFSRNETTAFVRDILSGICDIRLMSLATDTVQSLVKILPDACCQCMCGQAPYCGGLRGICRLSPIASEITGAAVFRLPDVSSRFYRQEHSSDAITSDVAN
jgi:hypothetical protein